jgi:hypothetical protein
MAHVQSRAFGQPDLPMSRHSCRNVGGTLFLLHGSEGYDLLFLNGLLHFGLAATGVQRPLNLNASADRHNPSHLLPQLLSGHRVQADDRP